EYPYHGLAWADAQTILYVRPDAAVRPFQVWRHRLGTATADDELVFEEGDARFYVTVGRARSGPAPVIESESKTTTEAWLVHPASPDAPPSIVAARQPGVEYHVEHHHAPAGDRLFIVT